MLVKGVPGTDWVNININVGAFNWDRFFQMKMHDSELRWKQVSIFRPVLFRVFSNIHCLTLIYVFWVEISHGGVIKWKHFPRYWPFVWGIHRSPVNSPHKGQWRGALMFSLVCAWINGWINNHEAADLRRPRPIMTSLWYTQFHSLAEKN